MQAAKFQDVPKDKAVIEKKKTKKTTTITSVIGGD